MAVTDPFYSQSQEDLANIHEGDEQKRLLVIASYDFDNLRGDAELARLARLAARICGASASAISIVGKEHQRLLVRNGTSGGKIARKGSFCAEAMLGEEPLEVLNAAQDPRFAQFEKTTGPDHVRYYVGAPLKSAEGEPIGALCLFDTSPRRQGIDAQQREDLITLADAVMHRLEAHRTSLRRHINLLESEAQLRFMLDSVPDIAWAATPGPAFAHFNARWREITGAPPPQEIDDWRQVIHPEDWQATLDNFTHAVETAEDFEDQWRLRHADGSYRWVLSRAVPSDPDPAKAHWYGTLTDIDDHIRQAELRDLLSDELSHRIKNIFAVVAGLIGIRGRGRSQEVSEFAGEITDLVAALNTANAYIRPIGQDAGDTLGALAKEILAPHSNHPGVELIVIAEDLPLAPDAATPLSLILHELSTNAAKHGALSGTEGRVELTIRLHPEEGLDTSERTVQLLWQETNLTPAKTAASSANAASSKEGFGSTLLRMSINNQLSGTFEQQVTDAGMRIDMRIPCSKIVAAQSIGQSNPRS